MTQNVADKAPATEQLVPIVYMLARILFAAHARKLLLLLKSIGVAFIYYIIYILIQYIYLFVIAALLLLLFVAMWCYMHTALPVRSGQSVSAYTVQGAFLTTAPPQLLYI